MPLVILGFFEGLLTIATYIVVIICALKGIKALNIYIDKNQDD